jgi:alkane 1-monooxygenase
VKLRALKYSFPLILFIGAIRSFHATGFVVWLPVILAWVCIPLIELFIKPDPRNLNAAEEEMVKADPLYDFILYIIVPLQFIALFFFLKNINDPALQWYDKTGRLLAMGLLCGVFGINAGHELGHRVNMFEQTMAKMLLLTSLYMHFFIEHNKGHHKRVATREDPSTARYGESIFAFYIRSVITGYLSAWHIAGLDMRKKGKPFFSWQNEMILFQFIQLAFIVLIVYVFGWNTLPWFLAATTIGFLLLETVNYIEHYGLQRKQQDDGKYARALPAHSWNSNHVIGRIFLFELSRHSDHHYLASRKYQLLRHHDDAPQMPTGYPGMVLLALLPPLWFRVMNKKIDEMNRP